MKYDEKYVNQKTFTATIAIFCIFIILYTATAAVILISRDKLMNRRIDSIPQSVSVMSSSERMQPQTVKYIIAEHNGKIGIFPASGGEPLETIDVYISTLPENDRRYLRKGIMIYSDEQLLSVIEDYSS